MPIQTNVYPIDGLIWKKWVIADIRSNHSKLTDTHTFMDLFIIYFKYSCLEPFSVVSPFDRIFQYYSKLFQSFRVMKPHSSCFNHTMRLKNEKDKFQSPDVLLPFSALLNNRDHHHIKRSF